jgi:hypothetical protein
MRGQAAEEFNNSPVRDSNNVRNSIISHQIGRLLHYGRLARARHNCYAYTDRYLNLSNLEEAQRNQMVGGEIDGEA